MWTICTWGAFSIVAHRTRPRDLLVRGRARPDLNTFADRIAGVDPKHNRPPVEETPDADYPFRLVASRKSVGKVLSRVTDALDYDNFKDEVGKRDPHRARLYGEVWATLRGIESGPRAGGAQPEDPPPTRQEIEAVLAYLPVFDRAGFDFGELRQPERGTLPMASYSREVHEFEQALYARGFVVNFNWPAWGETAAVYMNDHRRLADADLDTLRKLFTTIVRAARFSEGSLLGDCESGLVVALLRRLKELAATTDA